MVPAFQFLLSRLFSRASWCLPSRPCIAAILVLFSPGLALPVFSQSPVARLNEIKAAYISSFSQSVGFPSDDSRSSRTPITLGVIGDNPFSELVDGSQQLPSGSRSSGSQRSIVVRQFKRLQDAQGVHILYFSNPNDSETVQAQLAEVKGKPMLLLGECPRFLEWGGMVRFKLIGNYLHYELNLDSALDAGLQLDPRILRVADQVLSPKASFLKQLAAHVKFPGSAAAATNSPIRFGVLGTDSFAHLLGQTLLNAVVNGHPLKIRHFQTPEDVSDVQMLYLGKSRNQFLERDLDLLKGRPILLISDHPSAIPLGGMIRFYPTNRPDPKDFSRQINCLGYEMNLEAMKAAGFEPDTDLRHYSRSESSSTTNSNGDAELAVFARAARLREFPKLIEYPAEAFPSTNTPTIIGILGTDPFCDLLGPMLSGLRETEPIVVHYFDRPEDATNVHVLYLGQSREKSLEADLAIVKSKPILSVSQIPRFAEKDIGGMIRLYAVPDPDSSPGDSKWIAAWDLNLNAIRAANLDARKSYILKKAAHVISDNPNYAK